MWGEILPHIRVFAGFFTGKLFKWPHPETPPPVRCIVMQVKNL